ncbi:hypothetical protein V6N12_047692 [Hibiscus sabdariffa]|uniref:Uncharacterized protein n=1 Tax=Hibiscus sabdariffa TaxID=183260 RepID=A0ABR2CTP7_9ROSI
MEHPISRIAMLVFVLMSCLLVGSQPMQPSDTTFVSYLLALTWPPSACASTIRCNKRSPLSRHFTIHGLWPQDGSNNQVPPYNENSQCSTLTVVQIDDITRSNMLGGNLKQQLNRAWPNLMGAILNIDFWLDEWAKHGMCSDYGDNPVAYFSTAINLRNNVVSGDFTSIITFLLLIDGS